MVAAGDAAAWIRGQAIGGKGILPGQLFFSMGVFARQGKGQLHRAKAISQIAGMLLLHKSNLSLQWFDQADRQYGQAVFFALALAHRDLGLFEVNIFDAQAQAFH